MGRRTTKTHNAFPESEGVKPMTETNSKTPMAQWSLDEHKPVLSVDRTYIAEAASKRADREVLTPDQLTQVEATLSSRLQSMSIPMLIDKCINELVDEVTGNASDIKTYEDWQNAGFTMIWSIYTPEADLLPIEEWPLDLRAPEGVPDGTYKVLSRNGDTVGIGTGAIIKGGKFDPTSTEMATLQAAALSLGLHPISAKDTGVYRRYIERYTLDEETGHLLVRLGS